MGDRRDCQRSSQSLHHYGLLSNDLVFALASTLFPSNRWQSFSVLQFLALYNSYHVYAIIW